METILRRRNKPAKLYSGFTGYDPIEDFTVDREGFNVPAINIAENKDAWNIEIGAPGFCSDNYKIDLQNDILTVSANKQTNKENKELRYAHREFQHTNFRRSFELPKEADTNKIGASCKDGLLVIDIPKKNEAQNKKPIEINIS